MAKGVLMTKAQPSYKDIPGVQYHFGKELLDRIRQTLNDKIIFYEPRRSSADLNSRGGRSSYIAVATPKRIRPDPDLADHYFCDLENYLDFIRPVRFKEGGFYYEAGLQKADGSTNRGQFGHSVRIITDQEFNTIFAAGFADILSEAPHTVGADSIDDEPLTIDRPLVELTTLKPFRDRAFRRSVRQAYGNRCAVSGLAIVNAKGNPEVQAAHIRPVVDNGSDSVRNGLALTGTFHWLFDNGLIAVGDEMQILVADKLVAPRLKGLLNESGSLNLPRDRTKWPHPAFLAHHRKTYFVG